MIASVRRCFHCVATCHRPTKLSLWFQPEVLLALAIAACQGAVGGPGISASAGSGGSSRTAPGNSGGQAGAAGNAGSGAGGAAISLTAPVGTGGRQATSTCGNGVLDGAEQCDDGNTNGGDGCSKVCQIEVNWDCSFPGQPCKYLGVCGNGLLTSNKACDDGNTVSGDGCSADCQIEAGYVCRVPGKPCTTLCGDGLIKGTEQCDDGNAISGDGCSSTCKLEQGSQCNGSPSVCGATVCGNGVPEGSEGCDDGNTMPFDGCSEECQVEPTCSDTSGCTSPCGDGIIMGSKECDDGNLVDGDGCSSDCKLEAGWTCQQPPLGDQMPVPVIYRDFKFHNPSDFEAGVFGPSGPSTGMVESTLDSEGKPVYTGLTGDGIHVESKSTFAEWYRPLAGINHATASKLTLWKTASNAYVNRYGPNGQQWKAGVDGNPLFFPIDSDPFSAAELTGAQIPAFYDPSVPWDLDANGNNDRTTSASPVKSATGSSTNRGRPFNSTSWATMTCGFSSIDNSRWTWVDSTRRPRGRSHWTLRQRPSSAPSSRGTSTRLPCFRPSGKRPPLRTN